MLRTGAAPDSFGVGNSFKMSPLGLRNRGVPVSYAVWIARRLVAIKGFTVRGLQ